MQKRHAAMSEYKEMYNNDGYIFGYQKVTDLYVVCTPDGSSEWYKNPLEAWCAYENLFTSAIRRRIGDMLDRNHRDRYTGKEITV